jgi:hypothetical protein
MDPNLLGHHLTASLAGARDAQFHSSYFGHCESRAAGRGNLNNETPHFLSKIPLDDALDTEFFCQI